MLFLCTKWSISLSILQILSSKALLNLFFLFSLLECLMGESNSPSPVHFSNHITLVCDFQHNLKRLEGKDWVAILPLASTMPSGTSFTRKLLNQEKKY